MPRLLPVLTLLALVPLLGAADETAQVPHADGFSLPVDQSNGGYYMSRGLRAKGHLGEDWNGVMGGDTDLGDPVLSTAHGIVVFARDFRMGWGNVVIVRHAYLEAGQTRFVDSLYGHLHQICVREGQILRRGQKLGTIGNNRGMYDAHLHFEMRKDIRVGMFRNNFPQDSTVYWSPSHFIADHAKLLAGTRIANIPVNTFPSVPSIPQNTVAKQPPPSTPLQKSSPTPRSGVLFRVDRYSDMRLRE
jgi:murein DD-endopeptidase MepM/ murein hydrolase activator NlpD